MKILIVSGFLGAGKTTFIKELVRRNKRFFVVLENEYGEVGIDGSLLEGSNTSNEMNIWELAEGCICCSMKSDFRNSILTIANTLDPEYLIVEPTGVGMLSSILDNISKLEYERITLLPPITVLDYNSFDKYKSQYGDIYLDQIENGSTIIVTKLSKWNEDEGEEFSKRLKEINKNAKIVTRSIFDLPDEWWERVISEGEFENTSLKDIPSEPSLENIGLTDISLKSPNDLILFLNGVVSGVFGNISRSKGYLKIGEFNFRFDTFDTTYTITGIDEISDAKGVFIGNGLKRELLSEVLLNK